MSEYKIIDGSLLSNKLAADIRDEISQKGLSPKLIVIQVGDNPASTSYVKKKEEASAFVNIKSTTLHVPDTISEQELKSMVSLITPADTDGLLVQLPLPKHISEKAIIEAIDPAIDVDGFTPQNVGKMLLGYEDAFLPCTPHGILKLIEFSGMNLTGKKVCVLGRSNIVGKPLANLLTSKKINATVVWCHTGTSKTELQTQISTSDCVILACGVPNVIPVEWLPDGCTVIDVGVNRVEDASKKSGFRLTGDIYDSGNAERMEIFAKKRVTITPVPKGVGPMTVMMLMYNTLEAHKRHLAIS